MFSNRLIRIRGRDEALVVGIFGSSIKELNGVWLGSNTMKIWQIALDKRIIWKKKITAYNILLSTSYNHEITKRSNNHVDKITNFLNLGKIK